MDTTSQATLLALGSMLLGALALVLFVRLLMRRKKRKATPPLKATSVNAEPAIDAHAPVPAKPAPKVSQHSLFILFATADAANDQRLGEWLKAQGAHYDALKKVFLVTGQQPSNPITVANAFLPGELPDLFRAERAEEAIKGISLIVKPPLRKRRNQQMIAFVELAKSAAARFDAEVLDIDHAPATEATYSQIIGE